MGLKRERERESARRETALSELISGIIILERDADDLAANEQTACPVSLSVCVCARACMFARASARWFIIRLIRGDGATLMCREDDGGEHFWKIPRGSCSCIGGE